MQYAYTYVLIPWITILGHSDHKMGITIEFTLKFDAICIYIYLNSRNYHIRSLWSQNGYHNWIPTEIWCNMHVHMSWFQKLPYQITLITKPVSRLNSHWNLMQYGCTYPNSRNYHIRLLQSQNRYHDWIPTEISYMTPNELTREYPESNTQVCVSSMDTLRSSIFNSGMLIGHPPDFNIKLW